MPTRRRPNPAPIALLALTALVASSAAVRAQDGLPGPVPQPDVTDIEKRSGLLSHWVPIEPHLPSDPRRDHWYDHRWADPPNMRSHPNFYMNNGLYGLRWKATATRSIYPFYFGAPGEDSLRESDRPVRPFWRIGSALVHPWKPVGYYYDQGSYVPVYDFDPIVPGPGSWPWPWFQKLTAVGG
jgi:hypothetical protein